MAGRTPGAATVQTLTGSGAGSTDPRISEESGVSPVSGRFSVPLLPESIAVLRIAGAPPDPANLLSPADATFEGGLGSWSDWGNTVPDTVEPRSGRTAARTGTGVGGIGLELSGALVPGRTYRYEVYARVGAPGLDVWVGVNFYRADGSALQRQGVPVTSTGYQLYSLEFTVPEGAARSYVYVWKNEGDACVYADDVSVTAR